MADQEDYVIESVVAAQAHIVGRKIKWKYRVKWEGYASSENTWEPAGNMNSSGGDDDVLEVFWNKAPLDGRDREDVQSWKTKDTVWLTDEIATKDPECPKQPQRYRVTSRT
ncbi:hypothetical protein PENSPDRAFT_246107 [Peniophora sp. CONT]|nr:hypothetical protein PENSPDRAFT_246107 [Peniophora sp. CONT]